MTFIDVQFPVTGTKVPVDHGYALFSAVSKVVPEVHQRQELRIRCLGDRRVAFVPACEP